MLEIVCVYVIKITSGTTGINVFAHQFNLKVNAQLNGNLRRAIIDNIIKRHIIKKEPTNENIPIF